jgi:multidrug transporter EmrE-like cation transporter
MDLEMALGAIADLVAKQPSRPSGVVIAVTGSVAPITLAIFLKYPDLFLRFALTAVVLLGFAASFPILMLCAAIEYHRLEVGHRHPQFRGVMAAAATSDEQLHEAMRAQSG